MAVTRHEADSPQPPNATATQGDNWRDAVSNVWTAHQPTQTWGRNAFSNRHVTVSCSCGWSSGTKSGDLTPEWAAYDAHLDGLLPECPRGVCFCGRLVISPAAGVAFHASFEFYAHDAKIVADYRA